MSRGVWHRLIYAGHRPAIEHYAWGTGVNQASHAVLSAGGQYVSSADDVGLVVPTIRPPDSGLRRDVKHDVAPGAGLLDDVRIREVTAEDVHTCLDQIRIGPSG